MQQSTIAFTAVAAIVAWRVAVRVRRLVARQRLRLWQQRATVLVFPFLVGLLFVGALGEVEAQLAIAGGAAAGVGLAWIGFRRTRFEVAGDGILFYTPCGPIGIGLAAMLLSRIVYRGLQIAESRATGVPDGSAFALTPLTLFVFATLASYYSAYAFGLLRWHAVVVPVRRQRPSASS